MYSGIVFKGSSRICKYKRKLFEIVHSAQSAFSTEIVLRIYLASVEVAS